MRERHASGRRRRSWPDPCQYLDNHGERGELMTSLQARHCCRHGTAPGCSTRQFLAIAVPILTHETHSAAVESAVSSLSAGMDFQEKAVNEFSCRNCSVKPVIQESHGVNGTALNIVRAKNMIETKLLRSKHKQMSFASFVKVYCSS